MSRSNYNTTTNICHELRKGADNEILNDPPLNRRMPFKIFGVRPPSAADIPYRRPLENTFYTSTYLQICLDLRPALTLIWDVASPVTNFKMLMICRRISWPVSRNMLFATKSPRYHVANDDVPVPPISIEAPKIIGQRVHGGGGVIAAFYEARWNGILRPT